MIVTYDAEAWGERLGEVLAAWVDDVVPGGVEPLPHGSYSPVYAWMFSYEKKLKGRIERTLGRRLGTWERRLFGPDGAFSEGLSNAFLHGHRRDTDRPIRISCQVSRDALYFAIADSGPGFDVTTALSAMRRGGSYYHMAGNGLRCFTQDPDIMVAHADAGRTLRLLVPLTTKG